ncbi:MAG: hypothetical protein ACXVJ1_01965 [Candidatus Angelobacter sp.]
MTRDSRLPLQDASRLSLNDRECLFVLAGNQREVTALADTLQRDLSAGAGQE